MPTRFCHVIIILLFYATAVARRDNYMRSPPTPPLDTPLSLMLFDVFGFLLRY
jgi:hypothetical protein